MLLDLPWYSFCTWCARYRGKQAESQRDRNFKVNKSNFSKVVTLISLAEKQGNYFADHTSGIFLAFLGRGPRALWVENFISV